MSYSNDISDLIESLSLVALKSSVNPDLEDWLRYIFRFYSKTFSTPLVQVEQLPIDHVILTYFEERYWSYTEKEKDEAVMSVFTNKDSKEQEKQKAKEESEIEAMLQYAKARDNQRQAKLPPTIPSVDNPLPAPKPERISKPVVSQRAVEPEPLEDDSEDDIFMNFDDL